jgi:hypothetical protein
MIRSVLKLFAVSFLSIFGDPTHLWRVGICLVVGAGATMLTYIFWPGVLPIWPGAVMVIGAVAIGMLWEWHAGNSVDTRLK